jgi:hypothetical protein
MTLTIELPDNLEAALRTQANAEGVSEAGYIRLMLERDLTTPTAENVDAERSGMTRSQIADSAFVNCATEIPFPKASPSAT